jgi:hypothetical protein
VSRIAGSSRRALDLERDRTVLLFYEDIERDTFVRHDRHLRRALRRLYHRVRGGQKVSGFEVMFTLLVRALERIGWRVAVNDHRLARENPHYPVGVAGYPHILEQWRLPNPAVLGPGLFDHPGLAPSLMDDARFRMYLVTCDWMRVLFGGVYGPRCGVWYAGHDLDLWPDYAAERKDVDFLVYDKIRWDRETLEPRLRAPVLDRFRQRGLRTALLRYGKYGHDEYRALLRRSRGLVFLCESETQGMAYQEAMACNVPVLAWVNGYWLDPQRARFQDAPVAATSVPYFSDQCGETFAGLDDFDGVLDRFLARRDSYQPRRYMAENLSLERSGRQYLEHYRTAAAR